MKFHYNSNFYPNFFFFDIPKTFQKLFGKIISIFQKLFQQHYLQFSEIYQNYFIGSPFSASAQGIYR